MMSLSWVSSPWNALASPQRICCVSLGSLICTHLRWDTYQSNRLGLHETTKQFQSSVLLACLQRAAIDLHKYKARIYHWSTKIVCTRVLSKIVHVNTGHIYIIVYMLVHEMCFYVCMYIHIYTYIYIHTYICIK